MNTKLKYVILQKQIFHDLISYNGKALKTITHLFSYFVKFCKIIVLRFHGVTYIWLLISYK